MSSEGEGAATSLRSEKVIENGDFRGKGRWQSGRGAIRFWKMSVESRTDPGNKKACLRQAGIFGGA